jgi:hypothetical protein
MHRSSDCPLLNGYFVKNITSIRIKRFVKKTKLQEPNGSGMMFTRSSTKFTISAFGFDLTKSMTHTDILVAD